MEKLRFTMVQVYNSIQSLTVSNHEAIKFSAGALISETVQGSVLLLYPLYCVAIYTHCSIHGATEAL